MKRYTFQIIIEEGNDEFWESVEKDPGQGLSDLHEMLRECLATYALDDSEIRLIEFTDR